MSKAEELASDRRMIAIAIALCSAGCGCVLAFAGAMIERGFHKVALGELTIASGFIIFVVGLGVAIVISMVGLVISLRP